MKILFVADSFSRRSKQIIKGLETLRKDFIINLSLFFLNGDKNPDACNFKIIKQVSDIGEDRNSFDLIIFSSWAGEEPMFDVITEVCDARFIVDFQDCAEGLDFLPANDKRKQRQALLIEKASGMLMRDPRWVNYSTTSEIIKNKNCILFRDYFLEKVLNTPFNESCDLNKVCFIGSFGRDRLEPELGYTKIFEKLLKQKIQVIFIPKSDHSDYSDKCPYWKLAKKDTNFIFHKTVKMRDISKIINSCGIGLNLIQGDLFQAKLKKVTPEYLKGCSSSRLCDYTESGIGVGITASLKYMREIWAPSGACLSLDSEKLSNLKDCIAEVKYNFNLNTYKNWYDKNLLENNLSTFQGLIQETTGKNLIKKTFLRKFFSSGFNSDRQSAKNAV